MSSLAWLTIWGRADTGTHTSVVSERQPEAVISNQNRSTEIIFLGIAGKYLSAFSLSEINFDSNSAYTKSALWSVLPTCRILNFLFILYIFFLNKFPNISAQFKSFFMASYTGSCTFYGACGAGRRERGVQTCFVVSSNPPIL
jgi:hypothetical protein